MPTNRLWDKQALILRTSVGHFPALVGCKGTLPQKEKQNRKKKKKNGEMKRALTARVRGVSPSSSLASIGWAGHSRGEGIVRSRASIIPRRADLISEPEWRLYEKGDPKLFHNWKGKVSKT